MSNQMIDGVPRDTVEITREPVAEVVTRLGFPVIEWLGDSLPVGSALYAEQPAPVEWVPTVAQIRYRRPERDCPDWGPWHDMPIKHYNENKTSYIDSAGWECETRLLYLPVTKS